MFWGSSIIIFQLYLKSIKNLLKILIEYYLKFFNDLNDFNDQIIICYIF